MKNTAAHSQIWLTLIITVVIILLLWGTYFFYDNEPTPPAPTVTPTPVVDSQKVTVVPVPINDYLTNPGMGWQNDSSTGASSGYFPETVAYSSRDKIAWKNLNPQDGVYDWSVLEDQLANAIAEGKQYSFRVYTVSGESFGGSQIPAWVLERGAVILPSGEPDYSNCVYQQEWGRFVSELIKRYDGNPEIAYMDISGYGNFNEWNWNDQTEWDYLWERHYKNGTAAPAAIQLMDGQARRRLVDMFIGGSFGSHQCRSADGITQTVSYAYTGARSTQLVMPFAGIIQSTQYVFSRRKDVGFRYDCLGRRDDLPMKELTQIWKQAPVIYEFCSSENVDMEVARGLVRSTHPILIHNNDYKRDLNDLQELMLPVGYRFVLKQASLNPSVKAGDDLSLSMNWQNIGTAPPYAKMGQRFQLHFYLVDGSGNSIELNGSNSRDFAFTTPEYHMASLLPIPVSLPAGDYTLEFSIIDQRTLQPIQIAIEGMQPDGRYFLHTIQIIPSQ